MGEIRARVNGEIMPRHIHRLAIALIALFVLAGCGKKSRYDETNTVDVCGILSRTAVEDLLGPLNGQPKGRQASGAAGDCTWSFKSASGKKDATLYVMLMTHGSNGEFQNLGRWFTASLEEAKVSLGAEPEEVKDLGDRAYLFQTPQPDHSEIWMQQSKTYLVLRIEGGSSAQLKTFAGVLSQCLVQGNTFCR
jgi:hypothetical protein